MEALHAAGAIPASYVPEASLGRTDVEGRIEARLVEDDALTVHALRDVMPRMPERAAFLDGIQRWRVVAYNGVTPVVHAFVAAAVRGRGSPDRRLRTAHSVERDLVLTHLHGLSPSQRCALEAPDLRVIDLPADTAGGPPGRALEEARLAVERERVRVEKEAAARWADDPAGGGGESAEWLVVDGVLSEHARVAGHERALGVIKSHGAQYFEGTELERALTLPAGCRTSVFHPARRGARHDVYSWYLRLWPWEGNDLLYGLVRVEAPASPAMLEGASALSGWLLRERAPLATPDPRWDRLLYAIHDVETYLNARAPRDLVPPRGARLPGRTGT